MKFRLVGTEIHAGGQIDGDDKTNRSLAIFPTHLKKSYLQPVSGTLLYTAWSQTIDKVIAKNLKLLFGNTKGIRSHFFRIVDLSCALF